MKGVAVAGQTAQTPQMPRSVHTAQIAPGTAPRIEVGRLGVGEIQRRLPIYANAPEIWAREVVGFDPDPQQEPIIANYLKNKFTAVKSGHGTGKTASASIVGLHFLTTRPWALIPCTAPTKRQLSSILWKEFSKWTRHSPYLSSILEVMGEKVVVKGYEKEWYMEAVTSRARSRDDSNVGLQGFHGDPKEGGGIMYIVDEASGVPEASMSAVEGALTEKLAFVLMIGNPTHLTGTFYDAFHKDSDLWRAYTLSCLESDVVDPAYEIRIARKYGKESDIYAVKVLGQFPKRETEGLIPLVYITDALTTDPFPLTEEELRLRQNRVCGGLDVALSGANSTLLYLRRGNNVFFKRRCEEEKEEKIAEWTAAWIDYHNIYKLAIDCVGAGSGVYSHLRKMGYGSRIVRFKSGSEPFTRSVLKLGQEDMEFFNLRAQAYWYLRSLFYMQNIVLSYSDEDDQLREQLTSIRVKPSRDGNKIQVESKQDMRTRGLESPDEADALVLCFSTQLSYPITIPESARTMNPMKRSSSGVGMDRSLRPGAFQDRGEGEGPTPKRNPLSLRKSSIWSTMGTSERSSRLGPGGMSRGGDRGRGSGFAFGPGVNRFRG